MSPEIARHLVKTRERFESLPLEQIEALDWKDLEPVSLGGKTYSHSVSSFNHKGLVILVATLRSKKNVLGAYQEYALGSEVSATGEVRHLSQEDLWKRGYT